MNRLKTAVLLSLVLAGATGCNAKPEEPPAPAPGSGTAAQAAAGTSAVPPELVGTWQYEGMPLFYKMNSKGRVKFETDGTLACVGKFTVTNGTLAITYDPGQDGCIDAAMPYTLKDDGKTLDFTAAVYKKVDAKDDASF